MTDRKVLALILTCNRKELLLRALDRTMGQNLAADILIIDNSTNEETQRCLAGKGCLEAPGLTYIRNQVNNGAAGGFAQGMKYAYDHRYKYCIMMDDDGCPGREDTFSCLVEAAERCETDLVLLNALVVTEEDELSFGVFYPWKTRQQIEAAFPQGVWKDNINSWNGTLVSYELMDRIGVANADFFMCCDEVDYEYRAKEAGAYVATVLKAIHIHPKSPVRTKKGRRGTYYLRYEPTWRLYYRTRNNFYRARGKGAGAILRLARTELTKLILEKRKGVRHFRYFFGGMLDGLRGRLGKNEAMMS